MHQRAVLLRQPLVHVGHTLLHGLHKQPTDELGHVDVLPQGAHKRLLERVAALMVRLFGTEGFVKGIILTRTRGKFEAVIAEVFSPLPHQGRRRLHH